VPDVQILSSGLADVPESYTVPALQEIILKMVSAQIDGTNASGDFVPTLEIDNGSASGPWIFPLSSTITAGGSVDVTWFPHVAASAAAPATATTAYALGYTDYLIGPNTQSQTVLAGGHAQGFFVNTSTTDSNVMSWSTGITQYDTLNLLAFGTYLMFLGTLWSITTGNFNSIILSSSQSDVPHLPWQPVNSPFAFDSIGQTNNQDYTVAHLTHSSAVFNVEHTNNTAGNLGVLKQWLSVVYLPTG
jgi:hypothetical protein